MPRPTFIILSLYTVIVFTAFPNKGVTCERFEYSTNALAIFIASIISQNKVERYPAPYVIANRTPDNESPDFCYASRLIDFSSYLSCLDTPSKDLDNIIKDRWKTLDTMAYEISKTDTAELVASIPKTDKIKVHRNSFSETGPYINYPQIRYIMVNHKAGKHYSCGLVIVKPQLGKRYTQQELTAAIPIHTQLKQAFENFQMDLNLFLQLHRLRGTLDDIALQIPPYKQVGGFKF